MLDKDKWGEIYNTENNYKELGYMLESHCPVIIGWTDEEKKAIEYWRNETDWANWVKPCDMSYIVTLLNLIEKQQKEICRLQNIKRKDIQDLINNENENIYKNYISKDKIRAKIKELINNVAPNIEERDAQIYACDILEELLEEE